MGEGASSPPCAAYDTAPQAEAGDRPSGTTRSTNARHQAGAGCAVEHAENAALLKDASLPSGASSNKAVTMGGGRGSAAKRPSSDALPAEVLPSVCAGRSTLASTSTQPLVATANTAASAGPSDDGGGPVSADSVPLKGGECTKSAGL